MSLSKLEIPSNVVQRGNTTYIRIPKLVVQNSEIEPGIDCTLKITTKRKVQITF